MKRIKPFREWKKWKKNILIRKGIDISKIGKNEWQMRYKQAKRMKIRDCYWLKGKTYEEIHGKKDAKRIKKQISKARRE
jgi:hypothetical protein